MANQVAARRPLISRRLWSQLVSFVLLWGIFGLIIGLIGVRVSTAAGPIGEMDLTVLDAKTKEPIAVRLKIHNHRGRSPRIKNVPRLGNDFTFRDLLTFKINVGKYVFTIDRGPHYHQRTGTLEVNRDGFDQKTLELPRFVDVHKEGWYSGDLLIDRKFAEMELLMDAEELDFGVAASWTAGNPLPQLPKDYERVIQTLPGSNSHRLVDFTAGICDTNDGRALCTGLNGKALRELAEKLEKRKDVISKDVENGSAARTNNPFHLQEFTQLAKAAGAQVHLLDPFATDLPLIVARGELDSLAVLPDILQLMGDERKSRGRRPKDTRFRGTHGLGRYAQEIYFHLLNCGLRISPSAFSNSGETKNPPGYNRVYVACGQDFSADSWWKNLNEGRSIVSNGPVLRVRANGQLPGYCFEATQVAVDSEKGKIQLNISANLGTRQKVEYLEIVKNGLVEDSVRLDEWAKANGKLPPVEFEESGWLCVRAYAPGESNYRAALSAPFYVDMGEPRISKQSAKFFLDWVYERAKKFQRSKLAANDKRELLNQWKPARDYWASMLERANAK